ncbi:hypothetical protein F5Y06DRAFT_293722 [Hypoxylon sp. FL0890]|nr:hypothetical protein F5Y06DRAFT_293722 [Hypoxylon sp. FL0890]
MDDFPKTLVIAIVVSAVAVVLVLGIIYYIALNWANLLRRVTPDRWATPESERATWPQPRKSFESGFSTPISSPIPSPRSSKMNPEQMINNFTPSNNEPVVPPRNVKT